MKRLGIIALIIVLMLSIMPVTSASAIAEDEISSPSAVLMDANTGKILYEKNSREQRPCASITKVMTLTLVMEAIDSGKLKLTDTITTSAHAASMGGSDIWLEEGEQMTADDMIKATAVASANDAAVALAEHLCGTEDEFVRQMNEKAKALGMNDTVFMNCNGLDEQGHITSARDVAIMSRELIKHKAIFDYTSIWMDSLRSGETQIVNTNKLLKSYKGITGLKTGTTSGAGSCISATAERDGLSLIAIVLGADSGTERFRDAATLLDFGFANFSTVELKLKDKLGPVAVEGGMSDSVSVVCPDKTFVTMAKGQQDAVEHKIKVSESVQAPVEKGAKLGEVIYSLKGKTVASFDITAAEDVEKKSFSSIFAVIWRAVCQM